MHHCLSRAFAERPVEVIAVVQSEVVPRKRLASVFVYPLEDLIASGIAETGEKRGEFAAEGGGGFIFEDDFV